MSELPPPPPPPPRASMPPPPPPPAPPPPPPPSKRRFGPDPVGLPYVGWKPLTVLFGVLTAIGLMIFLTVPIAFFDSDLESTAAKDVAQFMVGFALFMGAYIFAVGDAGGDYREALRRLGFRNPAWKLIGLGALAWGIYLVCALVLAPLLSPDQEDVTQEIGGDGGALAMVLAGFLIIVVAPVSEEVFFRGFMFAGLRRSMPLWVAAVISAAVWGSLHLSGGNVGVAIQLAVFGVILAYLYEQSGSLWATIFAHGLNNTIAFLYLISN